MFSAFLLFQVNQQIVLEVPVDGVPDPEMVWKYADGSDVVTADNVKVKYAGNVAKIMFIPGKREERVLIPSVVTLISEQLLFSTLVL